MDLGIVCQTDDFDPSHVLSLIGNMEGVERVYFYTRGVNLSPALWAAGYTPYRVFTRGRPQDVIRNELSHLSHIIIINPSLQ